MGKKAALVSMMDIFRENDEVIIEGCDTMIRIIRQPGSEVTGEPFIFYGMPVTPMRLEKNRLESMSAAEPGHG